MFADDKYPLASHTDLNILINQFQHKLTLITKWLKESGLKLNEDKTEVVLFYRNDHAPIIITLNGIIIKTKTSMNVLGVQFDSKLTWHDQVNKAIKKDTTCNKSDKEILQCRGAQRITNFKLLLSIVL